MNFQSAKPNLRIYPHGDAFVRFGHLFQPLLPSNWLTGNISDLTNVEYSNAWLSYTTVDASAIVTAAGDAAATHAGSSSGS